MPIYGRVRRSSGHVTIEGLLNAPGVANAGVATCTAAALDAPYAQRALATAAALGATVSVVPVVSASAGLAAAVAAARDAPFAQKALVTASALGPMMVNPALVNSAALGPMMVNPASATAAAFNPQFTTRATATAAAYNTSIISGGTAPAGVAACTASARLAPMTTAQAIRAMATANVAASHLYFGSTRKIYVSNEVRSYQVPAETRTIQVGRS